MKAVVTLVGLVLAVLAAPARADRPSFDPAVVYKVPRGNSPAEGAADAPVTIVVWSDYACGYCNQVQSTLDQLARLYPGQLRWVHRTLPLDEDNTLTAEASLAASAQGRFWPMHDRMFAAHGHSDRAGIELIARELGLDMLRFRAALDTGEYRAQIAADVADARALGVTGTPTFFVNGRPVHGAQPLRVFAEVVDEELARARLTPGGYDALLADGRPHADAPADANNEHHELDPNHVYRVGLGLPGHQLGPDDAIVTIIEWSDFQCPYCARNAPVLAHARAKYGDEVRVIYRYLPMAFHRNAQLAAEAGVAAAEQGKFWAFHDQVFAHFGSLTRADLEEFAKAAGLDVDRFRAALDDRRYHDLVLAEAAAGEALGVDGTPTMFVNGRPVSGARDEATLDRIIDLHLARVRAAVATGLPKGDVYALLMSSAEGSERADPSRIPDASVAHFELRDDDRGRAVAAACRSHDPARAKQLVTPLTGDARRRVATLCAGEGIDLPH